ncbi:MAG: tetratricopeptide repeat protein [Myxococcota bacterium]
MRVSCEQCGAAYRVDDARVSSAGVKLKCPKCKHVFVVRPPETAPAGSGTTPPEAGEAVYIVRSLHGEPIGRFTEAQIARRMAHGELVGTEVISTDGDAWSPVASLAAVSDALEGGLPSSVGAAEAPAAPSAVAFGLGDLDAALGGEGSADRRLDADAFSMLPNAPLERRRAAAGAPTIMGSGVAAPSPARPSGSIALPSGPDELDRPAPAPTAAPAARPSAPPVAARTLFGMPEPPRAAAPQVPAAPPVPPLDLDGLDLPAPAGTGRSAARPASSLSLDDLDLPAPKSPVSRPAPRGPAASAGSLDLDNLDLPAPRSGAAPRSSPAAATFDLSDLDLPSPTVASAPPSTPPLSAPARASGGRSLDDLDLEMADGDSGRVPSDGVKHSRSGAGAPALRASDLGMNLDAPSGLSFGIPADEPLAIDYDDPSPRLRGGDTGDADGDAPVELASSPRRPSASFDTPLTLDGAPEAEPASRLPLPALPPSKWLRIVAAFLGFIAIACVLAGGVLARFYTDHGWFGIYWITHNPIEERTGAKGLVEQAQREMTRDTPEAYRHAVALADDAKRRAPSYLVPVAVRAQARLALAHRFVGETSDVPLAELDLSSLANVDARTAYERDKGRALDALASGRPLEAVDLLEKVEVSGGQKDAARAVFLGWALLRARRVDAAEQALTIAAALDPASDAAAYGLGLARLAHGKIADAHADFEKIVRRSPAHLSATVELGELAWKAGDAAKARQRLEPVLKKGAPTEKARAEAILGEMARVAGNLNEARKRFEDALGLDAKNVGALTGLGVMLHEAGKPTDAIAKCRVAKTLEPLYTGAALCLVRASLTLGKFLDARIEAEEILKRNPKEAEALFLLGRVSESLDQPDQAIERYQRAIEAKADYFDPYSRLAQLYIEEKKPEEAMGALVQAQGAVGDTAALRNAFGEVHLASGALDKARAEFEAAIAKDAAFHAARFNLASVDVAEGKIELAVTEYEAVGEQARDFPGLAERLGNLYLKMGQKEKAVAEIDRALAAEGVTHELRLAAAESFVAVGRFEDARQHAARVSGDRPNDARAHRLFGEALLGLGKIDEAIAELRQALGVAREPRALFALGRAYEVTAKPIDALVAYDDAAKLDKTGVDVRVAAARLRIARGAYREAIKGLQEAAKLDAKRADVHMMIGECAVALRDRRAALAAFEQASRQDPNNAEAHYKAGEQLHDSGKAREAISHLRRAVELLAPDQKPEWVDDAYSLLGAAYRDTRQNGQSCEFYRKYLQVAPDAPDRDEVSQVMRLVCGG